MAATTQTINTRYVQIARQRRRLLMHAGITLFVLIILSVYLMPLVYGVVTSLKTKGQASDSRAPLLPSENITIEYEGKAYEVFNVPTERGMRELALFKKGRKFSQFLDPDNPGGEVIEWEGSWRKLDPVTEIAPQWSNYEEAFNTIDFMRLLGNTLMYAFVTMVGAVGSAAFVAYGFARYRFPGRNVLFILMLSTIILPPQVTLIPQYAFFTNTLGWGGTWKPLIIPQFFGNAYNVFLLRQYFLTIPREIEEAARIDGAGPIQTFLRVILPQAVPALTAVCLFHFFFAWNDFFGPLIYLTGEQDKFPIAVGLNYFNGVYNTEPQLILAASVMTMILPLAIFFLAQRVFIQGIVITGVDK
jgi:multiple sugar transport system permease protein